MSSITLFAEGIEAREAGREAPTKHGRWRASDAGKCEIQQLCKAAGVPQDPLDYDTKLLFQVCSMLEDFVVATYAEATKENDEVAIYGDDLNVFADNDLNISGHADIIFRNPAGEITNLVEVKALNLFFFKHLVKESIESAYFYGQVQTYMHMADLDHAEILIVERNTPEVHVFPVEFDTDYWLWLRGMYERLNAYYDIGMLPSPSEVEGEMKCKFCPFESRCKGGEGDIERITGLYAEALRTREESIAQEVVGHST